MMGARLLLCALLLAGTTSLAMAEAKKSSTGVACNSTGTARKDGKDQDGHKMNCLWDTCTFCGTTSGTIDCSKQVTEYSNPTDCHPVANIQGPGGGTILKHSPITTSPSTLDRKAQ
jgi:hypothetical protein